MPVYLKPKSSQDVPDVSTFDVAGGLDMPGGAVGGALSYLPFLISIYKNVAARRLGTDAFLESVAHFAQKYQVPQLLEAGKWLAEKYPRVAAHMEMGSKLEPMTYSAAMAVPGGQVAKPLEMRISSLGLKEMRGAAPEIADRARGIMAHEATHTAQALGNSEFNPLYNASSNLVGYRNNPFEVMAYGRQAATDPITAAQEGLKTARGKNAMKMAEQIAVQGGQDGKAAALRKLLRERLGREPMAVSHTRTIP